MSIQHLEDLRKSPPQHEHSRSYEDLAILELILFALDCDRLVPAHHVLEELLVRGILRVELREVVALPVRCDVECRLVVFSTDDEGTLND